jgi:glycosyltransferase involved in cell wall biosynthesis
MPIRNEEGFITRSLDAVVAQDYPAHLLEILVVDGMSDDATRSLVQQMVDTSTAQNTGPHPTIRLLDNPAHIVPTAFNIGLQNAQGEVIVRVDGHCEIAPDYVRRCVEALEQTGADNVGGLMRAVGQQSAEAEAIALATSSPFGVGGARFHYATEAGWADTVYLGAYRREVFERIGGFDEELVRNQDDEFNFRLTQAGGKIWLDPAIKSLYYSRASLPKLWRQYYQYGFYKVRVMQKRGGVASWRHLVPGAFVLGLVGSILLALLLRKPLLSLGVLGPYALANAAASLKTARGNRALLRWLPLIFFALHTAYGVGFLAGMWHWTRTPQVDALKAQTQRPIQRI